MRAEVREQRSDEGLTAAEAAFIDRFTATHCRPHDEVMAMRTAAFVAKRFTAMMSAEDEVYGLAAAGAGGHAGHAAVSLEGVCAPDEEVVFTFADEKGCVWQANLTIPAKADASAMVKVKVRKGPGTEVGGQSVGGQLRVTGCVLPVKDGEAELPFGMFLSGLQDTDVWFKGDDGVVTPGKLMFFEGE